MVRRRARAAAARGAGEAAHCKPSVRSGGAGTGHVKYASDLSWSSGREDPPLGNDGGSGEARILSPPLTASLSDCPGSHHDMYVCRKMNNSQARTGHQRGMGGRGTDDDDTHERHTDTNRLTRHTASWLPHTLSWRTHNSGPHSPCRPPQHSQVPREQTRAQQTTDNRGERVRLEQACSASSNLRRPRGRTRPCVGSCEVSLVTLLRG